MYVEDVKNEWFMYNFNLITIYISIYHIAVIIIK